MTPTPLPPPPYDAADEDGWPRIPERVRAYVYRVAAALVALAVALKLVDADTAAAVLVVVAALASTGLATAYTSTRPH